MNSARGLKALCTLYGFSGVMRCGQGHLDVDADVDVDVNFDVCCLGLSPVLGSSN